MGKTRCHTTTKHDKPKHVHYYQNVLYGGMHILIILTANLDTRYVKNIFFLHGMF